ncbi:MAG: GntR family transcriptional regulator [Sphaerochaeta sp.]|nr:GntR family transcriptional regulator [Sphaerochaeta sp.]
MEKQFDNRTDHPMHGDSLVHGVYHTVLERLLGNAIAPGTIINRKALAEELGVSMAPVHEALARLTIEGFLDTYPRKGTVVKAINRDDLYGSIILREAIECQAARMYHGKILQDNREHLYDWAARVDAPIEDLVEHWKVDIEFHAELVRLSGCKTLSQTFKQVMRVGTFYQINTFLMQHDRQERLSHSQLIDDLCTDDPSLAESVIREHLKSGKRNFYKG